MVSPDGLHIAFASNRGGPGDLFVIRADGTGEMQLTHSPKSNNPMRWTSDGKEVVYSHGADDTSRAVIISRIGIDGSNPIEITRLPGGSAALSPDMKRVVYMKGTWTSMKLMLANLDGSNAKSITDGSSVAWNCSWSPDGTRIAFTTRSDDKSPLRVFIMNADGSERQDATDIPVKEGQVQWPRWSPDGRLLAVQVNDLAAHTGHLWIADVQTRKATKLAPHDRAYNDETPSWFPDAKHIAFQSDRTGKMEVWVMSVDGTEQRQVTGIH